MPLLDEKRYGEMRAEAYDVVLNGVEVGGGSIRIHEPELQAKMFAVLGVSEERTSKSCSAISCAPSAWARRRMAASRSASTVSLCSSAANNRIREVMAFPKNNRGQDLMSQSPADVDLRQLRELRNPARRNVGRAILAARGLTSYSVKTCVPRAARNGTPYT